MTVIESYRTQCLSAGIPKTAALAEKSGVKNWSSDLDSILADERYSVYFDAQTTGRRADAVRKAAAAGKHIYCEKPTATDTVTAIGLAET